MASDLVSLRVHNPTGAAEATLIHAPRLDTLAGKTICELSNGGWQHDRIFPAIRELLQKQFPTVKIIPYNEVVSLKEDLDNLEYVSKAVKEKGGQAVISGMAA